MNTETVEKWDVDIVPVSDPEQALTFDGRDNEDSKLDYYRRVTGIHWVIVCAF